MAARDMHARLPRALGFAAAVWAAGCGNPGDPPQGVLANLPGARHSDDLVAAYQGNPATAAAIGRNAYERGAAGNWQAVLLDPPQRGFRISSPDRAAAKIVAPREILFHSEGRRRIVMKPVGAARMAFAMPLPEGIQIARTKREGGPIHFSGLDLWVIRAGEHVELDWVGRDQAGWIGELSAHDSLGRRIPVSGTLTLPKGFVAVPSGAKVFKVGTDRAYGPYSEIEPGIWTSDQDPYPLAMTQLDGLFLGAARYLGPSPGGERPPVVLDSCGSCPRPLDQPLPQPRGEADPTLIWVRLGLTGPFDDVPGPLQTLPLRTWIRADRRDPTGDALVHLYARLLFPPPPLLFAGMAFMPQASLSLPTLELVRRWRAGSADPEARTLSEKVLPEIFFEARSADPDGFDRAVRSLVASGRPLLFDELVAALKAGSPRGLPALRLRNLVP